MTSCHPTVFPIKADFILFIEQTDLTVYQRLIGKLIYLSCGTIPNIAFVVGQLSRHNSNPQIDHLYIAKQVLHYLKRMITLGIEWEKILLVIK